MEVENEKTQIRALLLEYIKLVNIDSKNKSSMRLNTIEKQIFKLEERKDEFQQFYRSVTRLLFFYIREKIPEDLCALIKLLQKIRIIITPLDGTSSFERCKFDQISEATNEYFNDKIPRGKKYNNSNNSFIFQYTPEPETITSGYPDFRDEVADRLDRLFNDANRNIFDSRIEELKSEHESIIRENERFEDICKLENEISNLYEGNTNELGPVIATFYTDGKMKKLNYTDVVDLYIDCRRSKYYNNDILVNIDDDDDDSMVID